MEKEVTQEHKEYTERETDVKEEFFKRKMLENIRETVICSC